MFLFGFPMLPGAAPPERVAQALREAAASHGQADPVLMVLFEGDGLGRGALDAAQEAGEPPAALIPEAAYLDPEWLAARTVPRDHPSIRRPRRDMRFRPAPEILDAVEAAVGEAPGVDAAALAPVFHAARARLSQQG
ncbi:hypothetical protein ACQ5SO_03765 [Rhodovulum sp. DZ06]|uniref:hypothetical protein n=1 Tax=Rhodovulum sp. DZ06 TaxID=3425126 RepID=UPI003D33A4A6